jgi:hypothetical protein
MKPKWHNKGILETYLRYPIFGNALKKGVSAETNKHTTEDTLLGGDFYGVRPVDL